MPSARQMLLGMDTLEQLGGGVVNAAFRKLLSNVVADLEDRPQLKDARTITLKFHFKPVVDPTGGAGHLEAIEFEVECHDGIPKRRSRTFKAVSKLLDAAKRVYGLAFHPDLPDDPEGSTLYDEVQERNGGE